MRIKTGIDGLDEILQGGLLSERVYLLSGPPGSGKTTFCVQFLAQGAAFGEVGLYVSLVESPQNIIDDMSNYTLNVVTLVKMQKLLFADMGPRMDYSFVDDMQNYGIHDNDLISSPADNTAPTPASVYKEIASYVAEYNVKRLVIDSVSAIRFTSKDSSIQEKEMSRFIRNLKKLGCTTILISEMTDPTAYSTEQFASHGVIFLHNFLYDKTMTRAIQIIKMRGTKHDCNLRGVEFKDRGLVIKDLLR